MKKILVPTDFSSNAFKALTYAAEIAVISRSIIYLQHVVEPALNIDTMQTDSLNKKVIQDRTAKLNILMNEMRTLYPDVKIIPHLSGEQVVFSILRFVTEKKIDLIVMGTTSAGGGIKKVFTGTVATGTVRKSGVPVLTIPAAYSIRLPHVVVFATNRFDRNKRRLRKVFAIPGLFAAQIHVATFGNKNAGVEDDLIQDKDQLEEYLAFLSVAFPDMVFKGRFLGGTSFEKEMNTYCLRVDCDILAMIAYPRSFIGNLFQKSATRRMAFYSDRPVLAVPLGS